MSGGRYLYSENYKTLVKRAGMLQEMEFLGFRWLSGKEPYRNGTKFKITGPGRCLEEEVKPHSGISMTWKIPMGGGTYSELYSHGSAKIRRDGANAPSYELERKTKTETERLLAEFCRLK